MFHHLSTQTAIRIWQSHEQNLSLHCIASAAIGTAGIGVDCGSGSDALHRINMTHPQYVCIRLHVQDIHKTPQKPQKIKSIANHVLVSSKSCAFGSMTDFAGGTWNRMLTEIHAQNWSLLQLVVHLSCPGWQHSPSFYHASTAKQLSHSAQSLFQRARKPRMSLGHAFGSSVDFAGGTWNPF